MCVCVCVCVYIYMLLKISFSCTKLCPLTAEDNILQLFFSFPPL